MIKIVALLIGGVVLFIAGVAIVLIASFAAYSVCEIACRYLAWKVNQAQNKYYIEPKPPEEKKQFYHVRLSK